MTKTEAIIKARKILALAVRGSTDGERAAAKSKLELFMSKNNLTMEDLQTGSRTNYAGHGNTGGFHYRSSQNNSTKAKYSHHNGTDFKMYKETLEMLNRIAELIYKNWKSRN